ncbi:MAG: hypothetical protein GY822_09195 [Deltaproteobacteria bacterium]|nr:hypothetical protein [Deltaproteobacteria bacterium]
MSISPERKPKKLTLKCGDDGTFLLVDDEVKALTNLSQPYHDPLTRTLRPHINIAIIGVANKLWPRRSNSLSTSSRRILARSDGTPTDVSASSSIEEIFVS